MLSLAFDPNRAIQAAGVVLRDRGPVDWLRLLKILYIADREAIAESGKPIVAGRAVAMKHGPLHSEIYSLLKGQHEADADWSRHFRSRGHTVALVADPGRLDLSPYEIETLGRVADWAETLGTWELSEHTHGFPEWRACYAEGTSRTIPYDEMLRAADVPEEEIEQVMADNAAHQRLLSLFAG